MTSKDRLQQALENFVPLRASDSVVRLTEVLRMKIEVCRDRLEREEDPLTRGRLKELREIISLLTE